MASAVWAKMKGSNSRECLNCHRFENMDLAAQDRSARSKHGNALDEGETCIDCHKGVAHELPDEPEEAEATEETAEASEETVEASQAK
jgi:cytochrome c-type protein NapC